MGWTQEWAAEPSWLSGDREASCVWQPLCHHEAISGKKLLWGGPWDLGLGLPVPASPGSRGRERRRGGQGSRCPVSAARAESVWLTVSPVMSAPARRHVPSHGRASGPVGAGETDTACDQPLGPRSEVDTTRDTAGSGRWVLLFRASPAAGEGSEGRAQPCAKQTQRAAQPGGGARPRGAVFCGWNPPHIERLLPARLGV